MTSTKQLIVRYGDERSDNREFDNRTNVATAYLAVACRIEALEAVRRAAQAITPLLQVEALGDAHFASYGQKLVQDLEEALSRIEEEEKKS